MRIIPFSCFIPVLLSCGGKPSFTVPPSADMRRPVDPIPPAASRKCAKDLQECVKRGNEILDPNTCCFCPEFRPDIKKKRLCNGFGGDNPFACLAGPEWVCPAEKICGRDWGKCYSENSHE
jgi:hypothetical protein